MTSTAAGDGLGGVPVLSATSATWPRAFALRGVGRDPRAVSGVLERRRRRRSLGADPVRVATAKRCRRSRSSPPSRRSSPIPIPTTCCSRCSSTPRNTSSTASCTTPASHPGPSSASLRWRARRAARPSRSSSIKATATSSTTSPTSFPRRCSSSRWVFRRKTLRRWSTGCARSSCLGLAGTDTTAAEANAALSEYCPTPRRPSPQPAGPGVRRGHLLPAGPDRRRADRTRSTCCRCWSRSSWQGSTRRRASSGSKLPPSRHPPRRPTPTGRGSDRVPHCDRRDVVFAFVVPPARKLAPDIEFRGLRLMKKGQMVLMPLWSANRDGRPSECDGRGPRQADRRTATSPSAPDRIGVPEPTSPAASC